jgi:hypothetical protein
VKPNIPKGFIVRFRAAYCGGWIFENTSEIFLNKPAMARFAMFAVHVHHHTFTLHKLSQLYSSHS